MRRLGQCVSAAIVLVCGASALADGDAEHIYLEQNGYVAVEAESTVSPLGQWSRHSAASFAQWMSNNNKNVSGSFLGEGALQFTGNTEVSGPATSVLTYQIKIQNPGKYSLSVRGMEAPVETNEGDKANDFYARMVGQPEYKGDFTKHVLLGNSYAWSWSVKAEPTHHSFKTPVYDLAAGLHTFEVAGRSKNYFLDRFVLYKDISKTAAQDLSLAPSAIVPEPGTLALLALGAPLVLRRRRSR